MSKSNKFYDKLISKKNDPNSLLDNLYKPIRKNKGLNKTHFYTYNKNVIHQADLLFLPTDEEFKYALVVVDLHDRITDSRPLKTKKGEEIIEAFESIYNGKYLKKPKMIHVDAGSEFKGIVKEWFSKNKIGIRVAQPGRHNQQGIVENKNFTIGKALLKRQTAQEIVTGKPSTEWIDDLSKVIKAINAKASPVKEKNSNSSVICSGDACNLLNVDDLVRVMLDEPRAADESNKKLGSKFRASDLRWEIKPRKITNILLNPGQPPLYTVEGKSKVAYTKNQLQLVNPNEKLPGNEFINKKAKIESKPEPKPEPKTKTKIKKQKVQQVIKKPDTPKKITKTRAIKKPSRYDD